MPVLRAHAGAALGVGAAVLAALLLVGAAAAAWNIRLSELQAGLGIVLLGAVGCALGVLFDQLRHERALREAMAAAAGQFFAAPDEAGARRLLLTSLTQLAPAGLFELRDEAGERLSLEPAKKRAARLGRLAKTKAWTVWPLEADDRQLGSLQWILPGAGARVDATEQVITVLADTGASAIAHARLRTEKAEIESVARAEHLRIVLLDAVSHHFRSPLAGILGSVTSILNWPEPRDRSAEQELLLIIKEQANRLSRYVDNFLSLARLEAGSLEVNRSPFNLESLIYDAWDALAEVGGARRYFQVDLEADTIRSDPSLLSQVFSNVLENAIKYSPDGSLVEVRGRFRGDELLIEVCDAGSGAPEASLTRMFDRFYRSPTVKTPGVGLGLYLVRSLVEMLGGRVAAFNRTDGKTGLIVTIRLPIEGTRA
jgi:two-component system sensor histidine kinase KdpD